jgi:hypothetical protein
MKRLLLIGKKLSRLESIDWASCVTHNILDYQGLLFDCREMGTFTGEDVLCRLLTNYQKAGHPIYVILPDLKDSSTGSRDLQFLPYPVICKVQRATGMTVKLVSDVQPFVGYYQDLRGHEVIFEVSSKNPASLAHALPTVVDNLNRLVCGSVRSSNLHFFHPPSRAGEVDAFTILIDFFKPDFVEPEPEPPPEWASSIVCNLPGVKQIEEQIAETARQIDVLEREADAKRSKKQDVEKWPELLWLDGISLQERVREAFDFLGFQTEMSDPTGHSEDIVVKHGAYRFLLEVTGAVGSIKIDKGRELLQWILNSASPEQIRGVLIGNAFRKDPPDARPPTANHKLFTNDLEAFAVRFDFALMSVRDLYNLIIAKLEGNDIDLDSMCKAMSGKGIAVLSADCFRPHSASA